MRGIVARDGVLVAMKGVLRDEEIAALPPDVAVIATPALDVPGLDAKRHLVVMRVSDAARMTRILAVATRKAASARRRRRVNLAASLAAMKRRVLSSISTRRATRPRAPGSTSARCTRTVYHVLLGEAHDRRRARRMSESGGFDLVPANRELAGAEVELVDLPERETRLKDALAEALRQMRDAIDAIAANTISSCSTARRRCRC